MLVEPTGARPRADAELEALFAEGFPAFITADPSVKPVIGRVRECFPHLDIILLDGDADDPGVPVATGWGVAQWEGWTGLPLPGSGAHVIPDGLAPVHVDLDAGTGTYVEPNIWVRHR